MTANNRELNPTSHAKDKVTNDIRLFHPPGLNNEELISVLIPVSAIFSTCTRFDQCTNQNAPQATESAVLCSILQGNARL